MANEFGSNATVDAVHPRFRSDRNVSENLSTSNSNAYVCTECNVHIGRTLNDLQKHFDIKKHLRFKKCVYCDGNVYSYCFSSTIQNFHKCLRSIDKDNVSIDTENNDSISVSSNDMSEHSVITDEDHVRYEEHSVVNGNVTSDQVSCDVEVPIAKRNPTSSICVNKDEVGEDS